VRKDYSHYREEVFKGRRFKQPSILKLADTRRGFTIAHDQASRGWTTEDPDILKLTTDKGWTVAHDQALKGWTTEDPEILCLKSDNGRTVEKIQRQHGWKPKRKAPSKDLEARVDKLEKLVKKLLKEKNAE